MVWGALILGFQQHKVFIFWNFLSHFFAGVLIATAVFPFLPKTFQKRKHYFLTVFFPSVFGSLFPDLMFITSTVLKLRTLNGLFFALSGGGDIYSVFHFGFPIVLVVPTTVFFVFVMNRLILKKFDSLPKWSFALISALALFGAIFHIFMDSVGF